MPVTVCWAVKGGSGATLIAATLALSCRTDSLLVDLDGELPALLGVPEPDGQGVGDWLASDAPPTALDRPDDRHRPHHTPDPAGHCGA